MKHTITRTLAAVLLVVVIAGCSQHGDLVGEHAFIPAPTPTNVIFQDNGNGTYDITWSVDDDTAVAYYRLYEVNQFGVWQVAATTPDSDPTIGIDIGIPIAGYPVGISAVTVENVEGAMVIGVTP